MSLLKFLKGIFSAKKAEAEMPVTIVKSPEVFPPLVNQAETEAPALEVQADAPQAPAAEPTEQVKTVKEIKSKSKKAEAKPSEPAKAKPKARSKPKGGDAK